VYLKGYREFESHPIRRRTNPEKPERFSGFFLSGKAGPSVTSRGFGASSYAGRGTLPRGPPHFRLASMRFSPLLVPIFALAAAAACSSDSVTDNRTLVGLELALSPIRDTLFLGGPQALTTSSVAATATINGKSIALPGHVFESADTTIATVSSPRATDTSAVVTARGVGTTTVDVRVNGQRATTTIVVLPIVKSVTVTSSVSQALVRDTIVLKATALGWDGLPVAGQTFTFTSSSPSATVSSAGVVTFTAPGSATITARTGDQIATVALTALAREFIGGASTSLSSGLDATCGLLPLGRVFCFGKSPVTGIAKDTSCFNQANVTDSPSPCTLVPLPIAAQVQMSAVSVGDSVACGIAAGGRLYCWGDQKYGEVGNGISKDGTSALPMPVTGPLVTAATFTQISAGGAHACGIITSGEAFCWGKDAALQLGGGDSLKVHSSTPIPVMGSTRFKSISAGRSHTCGIRIDGVTLCWGANTKGQLGHGALRDTTDTPTPVNGPTFVQVSARGDNSCGLTSDGKIYCWGANDAAQTGLAPNDTGIVTPNLIPGTGYTYVAVGGAESTPTTGPVGHVCALQGTKAVCWGSNVYGQLGRNSVFPAGDPTPAPVAGNRDFTVLSVGTRTNCAIASDGAYCWGSSIFGAAGNQIQALAVTVPTKTAPPQ
jgi:alpha-tubulin suppressor-like RCC1 family protein